MGAKLLEVLKEEISKIKTPKMQEFCKDILTKCNDLNAVGPASASGKYHPLQDLGDQGLIRHTKTVVYISEILMRCLEQYDKPEEWDVVYVSCILHDMCKFKDTLEHIEADHPVAMGKMIREYISEKGVEEPLFERVAKCVDSHHSRWNEIKEYPKNKFEKPKVVSTMPTPRTMEQYLVVYSDLVAACMDLPEFFITQREEAIKQLRTAH